MTAMIKIASAHSWATADLGAVIRTVTATMAREIRIRRDANYLMAQSDHMLRDIGLSRDEVIHAVRDRHY